MLDVSPERMSRELVLKARVANKGKPGWQRKESPGGKERKTSVVRVAHHQAVARQRQKLVADFGVTMHIAWARHMLDNREFVIGGGTQPSTEPIRAGGLDGSAAAEERDNYHRDAYMNDRNHASGAPRPGCE